MTAPAIIFAVASIVPGGNPNAICASFDNGDNYAALVGLPTGVAFIGGAASPALGEAIFLSQAGTIVRTTDGINATTVTTDIGNGAWKWIERNEQDTLYVAVGNDVGGMQAAYSATAEGPWTRVSTPVKNYATIASYEDVTLIGSTTDNTQPLATSPDGVTAYALHASLGISTDFSQIKRATDGSFMFFAPGETRTVWADSGLSSFVGVSGLGGGQLGGGYDPVLNLYATSASVGVWTSPPSSPAWSLRASGTHFQNASAFVPMPGGGFVGLRGISGSETNHQTLKTTDGTNWTAAIAVGLDSSCAYRRLTIWTLPELPVIPDVVSLTLEAATAAITGAGFVLGTVSNQQTNDFPPNTVLSQFPLAGTEAEAGTAVSVTVAVPNTQIIPDVIGLTLADAEIKIRNAGFRVGVTTVTTEPVGPLGTVVFQSPPGGTSALPATKVNLTSTALLQPFNVDETVISQYSNSPTINRLVENMADYLDPSVNLTEFFNFVWNVDTAVGFGLDIWGNIVGVSRLLKLPSTDPIFGYINEDDPPDWHPFNEGIFFQSDGATQSYLLPDDSFRTLILTKALSNIVATSAASLNQLLRNLFPGRGKAYVVDLGNMAMRFVFEFSLTSTEYAILTQSGALPHPAGVSYSVVVISNGLFGFKEAGTTSEPFNFGPFYLPAG